MTNLIELQEKLKACSLYGLLLVTQKALTRAGYGDVQFQDRRQRRQKTKHGGHELTCLWHHGDCASSVVVKVSTYALRTRNLDEAIGTVDRRRADSAMVVSPHNLSPKVAVKQGQYATAPLTVLAGSELAGLVATHGVGLLPDGTIDHIFYDLLRQEERELLPYLVQGWL
ncbi:MAG TPA: hypothetical protein PKA27_13720 [Fimbriimonadaceae bacterium]|nr:hypothetical protein [Fimbriimonadaceae bacterium]